jgi:hypothetical protein
MSNLKRSKLGVADTDVAAAVRSCQGPSTRRRQKNGESSGLTKALECMLAMLRRMQCCKLEHLS